MFSDINKPSADRSTVVAYFIFALYGVKFIYLTTLRPPICNLKTTDGWEKIRLIYGLAELSHKTKKIRLRFG